MLKRLMRTARFIRLSKLPPFFRKNLDYGEGWTKKVDEAREEEDQAEDGRNIVDPIDTAEFCERPRNIKYWKEMGDDPAAKEYQKYVKKVKCNEQ